MDNYDYCIEQLRNTNLRFVGYPQTKHINVTDVDNVVQSYYTTTGTAVFRDGNDKYKSAKHTERGMSLERFIALCKGEEDILETFFIKEDD